MSPLGACAFVAVLLLAASALALVAGRRHRLGGGGFLGGGYLCDRCKYDSPRTCSRPERPNATACPDFKARRGRD